MQMLKQIASALAAQFGSGCEVVIHDFDEHRSEPSIVHIENGHVTGRQVGDGPSKIVVEQMLTGERDPADHLAYLTRTPTARSSSRPPSTSGTPGRRSPPSSPSTSTSPPF